MPKISIARLFETYKARDLPEFSRDRRTVSSTRRAARELAEERSPTYVADRLGISYQKWGAIRKRIEAGEIYSPEIRDKLQKILEGEEPKKTRRDTPFYDLPEGTRYFSDEAALKKRAPWIKVESAYMDFEEVREKLQDTPHDYLVITRYKSEAQPGKFGYHVVDVRTPREYAHKGRLRGEGTLEIEIVLQKFGKHRRWPGDDYTGDPARG